MNPAIGGVEMIKAWPMSGQFLALAYLFASAANIFGVTWTKPVLMPLLFAWALSMLLYKRSLESRSSTGDFAPWLFLALIFSWFGDLALMGSTEIWFLVGLGAFACAQIFYLVMFSKLTGPGLVSAWKFLLIPYLMYWIFFNATINAGDLRVPVWIYSALLLGMALAALNAALRLHKPWRFFPAYGAILFVISDSLIALEEFNGVQVVSGLIMLTYLVGQGMLVSGVILSQAPTDSFSRSR